jgi:hypothetical protein
MDALLRTHANVIGIPEAGILTCLRTNLADGGVDTEISSAAQVDDVGYLLAKTCWQLFRI